MKKFLLALPILLLGACSQKDVVKVEGEIDNAQGKTIYFDRLNTSGIESLDSLKLDEDGTFSFKVSDSLPEFYLLRLSNGKLITLLGEANEKITVKSQADEMGTKYTVEGSKGSLLVQELNNKLNETKAKLESIRKNLEEKKNDADYSSISQNLLADYIETLQSQRDFSIDFIMKNATSLASYMALYQKIDDKTFTLNQNDDINFVKIVASSMKALYPNHQYTKAILRNYEELEKRLNNLKMAKLIEAKGSNFPDIILPNNQGEEIKLSSLKGKFIVLSYWASQDANSRKQNQTLKKVYNKYHKKGLEIYQISVDQNENAWKKAIAQDQLNWINVCDLETGSLKALQLYNIQKVPANYLIDQTGEIVGKNLYGLALEEKVAEYVK
ncbi:redoxin domain-containing protein [Labilibaculum sp.]|uniref:redoxin domain-containing protein n=1 Tax=Labilibaculum sp. TaxID=2060723 RepID=UPI0035636207